MSYAIMPILDTKEPSSLELKTKSQLTAGNRFQNELTTKIETLVNLLSIAAQDWESRSNNILNDKIQIFYEKFGKAYSQPDSPGFLEKHILPDDSDLAVIGDIHGNDTRLLKTLSKLQERGYFDEQYRCLPKRYIIFLGDYVDRGTDSLKVVELLITLKEENPNQVFLIRGNHEDLNTSKGRLDIYASSDHRYRQYMEQEANQKIIERFYLSLPSVVYIGQKAREGEKTQYIHYSHALFHLFTDPAPLLDSPRSDDYCVFSYLTHFSWRITNLCYDESLSENKRNAILKLFAFKAKRSVRFDDVYWNDIGKEFKYNDITGRTTIPVDIIQAYLIASGTSSSSVKRIIRGHQLGGFWGLTKNQKLVVITIDPSGDNSTQTFLELKLAAKVNNYIARKVSFALQ